MVTIKLTEQEANDLYDLVKNSKDTGNDEWDKTMQSINDKIETKLDLL